MDSIENFAIILPLEQALQLQNVLVGFQLAHLEDAFDQIDWRYVEGLSNGLADMLERQTRP